MLLLLRVNPSSTIRAATSLPCPSQHGATFGKCSAAGRISGHVQPHERGRQWFIWLAVVVALALIVAVISYHVGWWPELPVWAVLWRWMRATG
jgi:hypothetical protein